MQVSSAGHPATVSVHRRELSAALRAQVFAINSADVGGARASGLFGAVLEIAFADAVISLITLHDGSVSVYVSDGNGCIGCGAHADVRAAATELLSAGESVLPLANTTATPISPPPEHVRAFLLTTTGIQALQMPLDEARRHDSPLGQVYVAGLHVLQTVERTRAGRSLHAEIEAATHTERAAPVAANENEPCWSVGNAVRRLRT